MSVFPIPGSQVAPPQTQIAFRGAPVSRVGRLVVTGSRSGIHAGKLVADSDGRGGSFLPDRSFTAGELVTVKTQLRVRGAGRTFSFRVAQPAGALPEMPLPPMARQPGDVLSFRSRPDLMPPAVEITHPETDVPEGDIFVAPQQGPIQDGPMILDPAGKLVWFDPLPVGTTAADFRVQSYHGKPALTWWQGHSAAGVGVGEDVIFDSSYRQVARVRAADGLAADLHEFELMPDGNALITAYYPVYWDPPGVHGARHAIVLDSVVQEIDIKTGLLLFQWDSLDHVPLSDSYEPPPKLAGRPYDYFHINSIQRDAGGNLVISARNTWAAYKVDSSNGHVIWTLGGKRSTFKIPTEAAFAFQHHVRVRDADDRVITVFDDGAGPPQVHAQSRGLTLQLNMDTHRVTLIRQDQHSPPLLAAYEGNMQTLPNGDHFVGWGQQPYFSEFDPNGQLVFDGRFLDADSSYRAYRFPWTAAPARPPAVAAAANGAMATVYASWNGATGVSRWQILAGSTPSSLHVVTTLASQGFETEVTIPDARYVVVRALDASGGVLGTSAAVRPH